MDMLFFQKRKRFFRICVNTIHVKGSGKILEILKSYK